MNEILNNKSLHLNQIYGRSKFRPKNITDEVEYVKKLDGLKNSDFYFIAVSDNEIEKIKSCFLDKIIDPQKINTLLNIKTNDKNTTN